MPTLETERLILRDFVPSDWDALNTFLSDPSVTRFMHFSSWDEQMRREWLASLVKRAENPQRDAYDWAITLQRNGQLIGWLIIGRSRHTCEEGMRECGCGYALNRHYWGQNYIPEALQAAFAFAFTMLGTKLIYAECQIENTTSARVMQKCGMQYEKTIYDDDGLGNWELRYRYVISAESGKM